MLWNIPNLPLSWSPGVCEIPQCHTGGSKFWWRGWFVKTLIRNIPRQEEDRSWGRCENHTSGWPCTSVRFPPCKRPHCCHRMCSAIATLIQQLLSLWGWETRFRHMLQQSLQAVGTNQNKEWSSSFPECQEPSLHPAGHGRAAGAPWSLGLWQSWLLESPPGGCCEHKGMLDLRHAIHSSQQCPVGRGILPHLAHANSGSGMKKKLLPTVPCHVKLCC